MKSSPRPPRRFSRWQTTKRTFVLGGIGPKAAQNSTAQEPRETNRVPVAENRLGIAQQLPGSGNETGNSFDSDGTNTSRGPSKPKHVRRLRLNSSRLLRAADKTHEVLKPVEQKTAAANGQIQVLLSASRMGAAQEVGHRSFSSSDLSPNKAASTSDSSPRKNASTSNSSPTKAALTSDSSPKKAASTSSSSPRKNASTSGSSPRKNASTPELSLRAANRGKEQSIEAASIKPNQTFSPAGDDVFENPAQDRGLQVKSPSKRSMSSASKENAGKRKEAKNGINDGTNNFASPETDMAEDMERNSKSLRGLRSRLALQEVSQVSHSNSIEADKSLDRRSKLRDRSKLKSPDDLLMMRQYPEKYFASAKKPTDSSVKKLGSKVASLNISNKASSQRKSAQAKSRLPSRENNKSQILKSKAALRKNNDSQISKSKISPKSVGGSPKSFNKKGFQRKPDHADPEMSLEHPPIEIQPDEEMRLSQGRNSEDVQTHKRQKLENFRSHSTLSISQKKNNVDRSLTDKENINKQSTHSRGSSEISPRSPTENVGGRSLRNRSEMATPQNMQEKRQYPISFSSSKTHKGQEINTAKSYNSPLSVPQNKSDINKHLTGRANKSKQSSVSRESSEMSPRSSKENFGGRSLRNRSKMATPESMEEKRQYPISFYSSKVQKDILNSSVSSKTKSQKEFHILSHGKKGHSPKQSKEGNTNKNTLISKKINGMQGKKSLNISKANVHKYSLGKVDKSGSKNQTPATSATSRKRSSKLGVHNNNLQVQQLSLPRQPKKRSKQQDQSGYRQIPAPSDDNQELPQDGQSSLWDIQPVSTNSVKTARPRQRIVGSKASTGSAIDETVLVSQSKVPRKRKLVEQLSQEEPEDNEQSRNKTVAIMPAQTRKVFLWCEEGQNRSATDVTAYDVIFQAAVDTERDLSSSTEDRQSKKLVQKVFSGFKNNMKSLIAQEMHLKELQKEVKERQKRCKILLKDVAEKQAEGQRLKQELASLESNRDSGLQRISSWMRDFAQLAHMAQEDESI